MTSIASSWSPGTVSWILYFGIVLIGIMLLVIVYVYWPQSNPALIPPTLRREVGVRQPCNDTDNFCGSNLICHRPDTTQLGVCLRPLGTGCSTLQDCTPDATSCTGGVCIRLVPEALSLFDLTQVRIVDGVLLTTDTTATAGMTASCLAPTASVASVSSYGSSVATLSSYGSSVATLSSYGSSVAALASAYNVPIVPIASSLPTVSSVAALSSYGSSVAALSSYGSAITVVPCHTNQQCTSGSCMVGGRILVYDPARQSWVQHSTLPAGVKLTRLVGQNAVSGEIEAISITHNANTDGLYRYNGVEWTKVTQSGMWTVVHNNGVLVSYRLVDMAYSSTVGLLGVYNVIHTDPVTGTSTDEGNRIYHVTVNLDGTMSLTPFRTLDGLQRSLDQELRSVNEIDINSSGDVVIVNSDWSSDLATVYELPAIASSTSTFQPTTIQVPLRALPIMPRFYTNRTVNSTAMSLTYTLNGVVVDYGSSLPTGSYSNDISNLTVELVNGQVNRTVAVGLRTTGSDSAIVININGTEHIVGYAGSDTRFLVTNGAVLMYSASSCV